MQRKERGFIRQNCCNEQKKSCLYSVCFDIEICFCCWCVYLLEQYRDRNGVRESAGVHNQPVQLHWRGEPETQWGGESQVSNWTGRGSKTFWACCKNYSVISVHFHEGTLNKPFGSINVMQRWRTGNTLICPVPCMVSFFCSHGSEQHFIAFSILTFMQFLLPYNCSVWWHLILLFICELLFQSLWVLEHVCSGSLVRGHSHIFLNFEFSFWGFNFGKICCDVKMSSFNVSSPTGQFYSPGSDPLDVGSVTPRGTWS